MSRTNSKIDIFVKLSLVFCLMLLAFSMGTYVGKQVSDTDHKRKQLEIEYSENMPQDNKDSVPAVSDEESVKLAEDMVKAERAVASEKNSHDSEGYRPMGDAAVKPEHHIDAPDHHAEAAKHEHHEDAAKPDHHAVVPEHKTDSKMAVASTDTKEKAHKSEPAHKSDAVEKAASRVAESLAPAADPKKVRGPSTQLPSVATTAIGKFTVQVASYANESEAKAHAEKLKEKGFPAFYVPADIQGRNWFRVSVGYFVGQKEAMDYRAEILKAQVSTTAIVQKIVK